MTPRSPSTLHRRLVVLDDAAEARRLVAGLPEGGALWLDEAARGAARRHLGRAYDAVVIEDAALDGQTLGQLHGCVRGGGALVLVGVAGGSRFRARLRAAIARAGFAEGPGAPPVAPSGRPDAGTAEQARAVARLVEVFSGPPGGAAALLADRGRGKSAALGLALARLDGARAALTGPAPDAVAEALRFAPGARFVPLDALVAGGPVDAIAIDEAAQIPVPALRRLVERHPAARFVFATTARGYEGTGRGFVLRFLDWLAARGGPVARLSLSAPIRWAAGDPLERFVFDALLLDAEPDAFAAGEAIDPAALRAVALDRGALAADERRLRAVFGLLVGAHYRTTPRDLEQVLDGPSLRVHALLAPGPAGPRVAAVNLVSLEGGLSPALCDGLYRGVTGVRGHALAETLVADAGRPDAGGLSMVRSVRIATHPALRRLGLARRLTEAVHGAYAPDLFGTLFGATPGLLAFRRALGYRLVRVGVSAGRRAGEPAAVMVRPVSPAAAALVEALGGALARDLPRQLALMGTDMVLDPALAGAAMAGLPAAAPLGDAARDRAVAGYAFGPRPFESAALPILRFVEVHRDRLAALAEGERAIIAHRVVEGRSWAALAGRFGGVRPAMRALRRAVRALALAVDPGFAGRA